MNLVRVSRSLEFLKKIMELDESVKKWQKVCSMPDHLSDGTLFHSSIFGLWGKICFYRNYFSVILIYDLLENRW